MKRKNPKRDYNLTYDTGLNEAQALTEGIRRHGPSNPDPRFKPRKRYIGTFILEAELNQALKDFMAGWMRDRQIRRFRAGGTAFGNGHGTRSRVLQVIPARAVKKGKAT